MSWYEFGDPVQGPGGFGPNEGFDYDDEDEMRRRQGYRSFAEPYGGATSLGGAAGTGGPGMGGAPAAGPAQQCAPAPGRG